MEEKLNIKRRSASIKKLCLNDKNKNTQEKISSDELLKTTENKQHSNIKMITIPARKCKRN